MHFFFGCKRSGKWKRGQCRHWALDKKEAKNKRFFVFKKLKRGERERLEFYPCRKTIQTDRQTDMTLEKRIRGTAMYK